MNNNIQAEKNELRKLVKELKAKTTFEEKKVLSISIWNQIEMMDCFRNAAVVLAYWSLADEVHTHDFIQKWSRKKVFILPVVDGSLLRLKKFEGLENMRPVAPFGILEPQGPDYNTPEKIQLVLVPGLAFDHQNHRMGRGKGFYDHLLPGLKAYKIGVCFCFQKFHSIPVGTFDVAMDRVITDQ